MILEEMTTPQVEEGLKKSKTILLPFGSIEEHGPHLPLSTDQLTIYEVCREAAGRIPVFVAPRIYYGVCRSTNQHPGTISISTGALKHLAQDIVCSLYTHGFRNFIMVSGHAGSTHMAALTEAGERILELLPEANVAVLSIIGLITPEFLKIVETQGDSHAGEVETSLVMHLRPDWVRGTAAREFPRFPLPILVRDKRKWWPGGVWGDPGKAGADKGEKMFSLLVDELVRLVGRIESHTE